MKIITISREFGSGGRELGKRLADLLGYEYYDKEIISEIARCKRLDKDYVEKSLSTVALKSIPVSFGRSVMPSYNFSTELMLEERRIIEEIASRGKDFIIVGRNADILLKEYKPLNIFVCADHESKVQRCIDKALIGENPSRKEIEKHLKQIDKSRESTRAILSETKWGECTNYHLTINTTGWEIKELTPIISKLAELYFGENK